MNEDRKPSRQETEHERERERTRREEHDETPRHEHSTDESWSTPRWGPLLDEHDTGVKE